jgi:hypothetical protein
MGCRCEFNAVSYFKNLLFKKSFRREKMTATVTTKEPYPLDTQDEALNREIELRIQAGAIRAWVEKTSTEKILFTEWNVLGQND